MIQNQGRQEKGHVGAGEGVYEGDDSISPFNLELGNTREARVTSLPQTEQMAGCWGHRGSERWGHVFK